MAVGLSSQERFPVRKWRPRTVLALFSAADNREWTDHLPSKTSNTYVMINETNPENGVNGTQTYGEGSSPSAATGGQQPVPSHQQTTTQRRVRRKWYQEDNRRVMECYYQSTPSRNGYRKRMLQIWVEKGMFQVTEQRLVVQANQIRTKQWLSELELEEIRRLNEGHDTGEVGGSEEDEDEETDISEQEEVRTDLQLNEQNCTKSKTEDS